MELYLKPINKSHSEDLLNLFLSCQDFFQMAEDKVPDETTLFEFFEELPPSHSLTDKLSLGIYHKHQLIGAVDVLKRFATPSEWMIGLLLISPQYRGKRLGEQIHKQLVLLAQKEAAKSIRIGVVTQNTAGYSFWKRLGYSEVKRTSPMKFGNRENIVIVMRLELKLVNN